MKYYLILQHVPFTVVHRKSVGNLLAGRPLVAPILEERKEGIYICLVKLLALL